MPNRLRSLFLHPLTLILAASPVIVAFIMHVESPPAEPPPAMAIERGITRLRARQATFISQETPGTPHGTDGMIWIDGRPRNRGLVRFDLAAIPADATITSATLRLYVTNYSPRAGLVREAGGRWLAKTATWNNAPPIGPRIATLRSPAELATWRVAPVRDAAIKARSSGDLLNFYITSSESDGAFYAKGATRGPQLLVRWTRLAQPTATPRPTRTPSPTATATSSATPDPTATPSSASTVIAAGDIAECGNDGDEQTAALVKGIGGTVLTLGDTVYESGTSAEFRDCYEPGWGQFKSRTRPAVGNHEYLTDNAAPYFAYFGASAGKAGEGWYAFDEGSWRIYALNSNCSKAGGCDPGSPQYEWLKADLAANPRDCVLAYWHHPLFTDGPHADDEGGGADSFWDLLYRSGADVVLNGHDHHYQRWVPQDPHGNADASRGIREFVVGTGGKGLSEPDRSPGNLQVSNADSLGVLVLRLQAGSYSWEFKPISGNSFSDSGSGTCH